MNNYQVTFRNGPTIMVRATCIEGARIEAAAQARRSYKDIISITRMASFF